MTAGSEQATKPPQVQGDNGPSPIDRLMRELGATRWDPTPVDQHDYFLDPIPGESSLQRALAWMRAHTIRRGRSQAYAVDEKGNALHIERMAADLDWRVKWAQEVWRVPAALVKILALLYQLLSVYAELGITGPGLNRFAVFV
jgi:hypothetical protein